MHARKVNYRDEFRFIDWLIANGGLQRCRKDRLHELGAGGIIGLMCTDGRYTVPWAGLCSDVSDIQHFDKVHGAGFLLGLSSRMIRELTNDPAIRKYIRSAQFVLMADIEVAYHKFGKGTTIFTVSHAPDCGQAGLLGITTSRMILATMRSDEVITRRLHVGEEIVLPMLVVDRTPNVHTVSKKSIEWHIIKKAAQNLIRYHWKG